MTKRNPKQEGSSLWDCIPQTGPCPNNCNQCFYNRPGAFYVPLDKPTIPSPEEVGNGIVRMNCGHDSNIQKDLVIETAKQYKNFFFNTSIPRFDFPGPVVWTANPKEEQYIIIPELPPNLMFVRLRVSTTNLEHIKEVVCKWTRSGIQIVLTFMAYYDVIPKHDICDNNILYRKVGGVLTPIYQWRVRHINSYWCPTKEFMSYVLKGMKKIGGRLVTMCGTLGSAYCKDCGNCEIYYWRTMKHLDEIK